MEAGEGMGPRRLLPAARGSFSCSVVGEVECLNVTPLEEPWAPYISPQGLFSGQMGGKLKNQRDPFNCLQNEPAPLNKASPPPIKAERHINPFPQRQAGGGGGESLSGIGANSVAHPTELPLWALRCRLATHKAGRLASSSSRSTPRDAFWGKGCPRGKRWLLDLSPPCRLGSGQREKETSQREPFGGFRGVSSWEPNGFLVSTACWARGGPLASHPASGTVLQSEQDWTKMLDP